MTVGPELSQPAPIRSPGGHARPYDETERRLERLLDLVPITRIYDAAPLDRIGLPVWSAVTPLAADLTVHAGKGASAQAARISAIMEAIERVSAEAVPLRRVRSAPFADLEAEALDPELFDLPFSTAYTREVPCSWIEGHDLLGARDVWVALDLVISPARERICTGPETNGLAAGNTVIEAVLHAVYELIERDAAAHERFLRRYGEGAQVPPLRLVSLDALPTSACAWIAQLQDAGLRVTVQELTHDVDVPVFRAVLTDRSFPGREGQAVRFEGLGCDLDPERALIRALSEAGQSHTAVLVGARDAFEGNREEMSTARFLERLLTRTVVEPFAGRARPPDDLTERLRIVLERLAKAGFRHCVMVELTRADLQVPVVRVLVPGAAGPVGETTRRPSLRLLRGLR